MQIKRFEAGDMQEALKQVKETMGPEAIILSTKTIKPPSSRPGYARRTVVEVVAAIDPNRAVPSSSSGTSRSSEAPPERAVSDRRRKSENPVLQKLVATGLTSEFIQGLAEDLSAAGKDLGGSAASETLRNYLYWKLMEAVDVTGPVTDGRKIWVFIGPTGVGKTTTLAKLAAHYTLKARKKIGLVTIDTFRIGAVDQLKTYAQILNVPLEVATRPEELKRILEQNTQQDLLLVDTVGRSPRDSAHLEELGAFLSVHPQMENHLLLSATTKESDMGRIVQRYSLAPIQSYIFTKLDETEDYAPLFNQILRDRKPVSYLTHGQNVPEDIELATKGRVANLVLNAIQWN